VIEILGIFSWNEISIMQDEGSAIVWNTQPYCTLKILKDGVFEAKPHI